MKILWLTEFYPSSGQVILGGVQTRCYYVGKRISQNNILKVIEGVSEKHAKFSIKTFFLRLFSMPLEIYNGLKIDCDLIEASNTVMYFPAWLIAKIKRKPVVFWYPDVLIGSWVKNFGAAGHIGEVVEKINLRLNADHYIAISHVVKNKLIDHGIPKEKITVIYCGVDEKEISEIKISQKKRDLIVVSRLIKYKNVDHIISALTPDISLSIIGWGPERNNLEKLSGENVTFLGKIPSHTAVLTEIAKSKVFCHPSSVEGFGISIIEALALGVPAVLPDTEIAREITKDGQGAVISNDFKDSIHRLLTDKKLYATKSAEGKELVKNYNWTKISQETLNLYERLITS